MYAGTREIIQNCIILREERKLDLEQMQNHCESLMISSIIYHANISIVINGRDKREELFLNCSKNCDYVNEHTFIIRSNDFFHFEKKDSNT